MSEGRKSQVILLDDRRLDIIIQPKLYSSELLDLVASHFKLREKHYFGLGFIDETYHFNWLQGDKRVLDHDFPKKTGLLILHFAIKFYVETIGLLRDAQTVELFYLNARQAVFRNQIECDVDTVFELAAHVLQATNGDFVSEEETREELKKLPVLPTSTLRAHPSIAFCEDRVIQHYTKLSGSSRGLAIVNYMTIVESLPTYGIHYYEVKDKKDIPWWLGISPKGIAVYDKNDKTTPRRLFTWKNLENLYYGDKKFSIEVHGPKRVSVSRRTFGASNVDVHAWFAGTAQLTKCIWSMAVAQHQFYLDRKQSKSQLPTARSMSEIAADLCRSTTSLPGSLGSDLSRSPSSHSLPSLSNSRYDLTIEQSDSLKAERDMHAALLARRDALQEALNNKLEELKSVCLQEGELTGDLPPEYPLTRGEQPPLIRRRVGTTFSLSTKKVQDSDQISSELSKLELEVELQSKITSAAHRLASDKTVNKFVRKQRRQSYTKAVGKLKDMEKKLSDMRKQAGKVPVHSSSTSSSLSGSSSVTAAASVSPTATSKTFEDRLGPLPPVPQGKSNYNSSYSQQSDQHGFEDQAPRNALSPSHSSPQLSTGYTHNGSLPGRGSYSARGHGFGPPVGSGSGRNSSDFDTSSSGVGGGSAGSGSGMVGETPSTLQLAAALRLDGSHDSGFSSANNMYNVHSQRTSHYESSDQLRSPASSEPGVARHSPMLGQDSSNSSVVPGDEPFIKGGSSAPSGVRGVASNLLHYGSLDRKQTSGLSGYDGGDQSSQPPHYRTEVYRDLSPVRYPVGRTKSYSTGCGAGEPVNPSGVILEVAVQHQPSQMERGRSVPPSSSSSSLSSSSSYKQQQQQPSSPGSGTFYGAMGGQQHLHHQHRPEHYRPYDSGSHRQPAFTDNTEHLHSSQTFSQTSQPVYQQHRERSLSPSTNYPQQRAPTVSVTSELHHQHPQQYGSNNSNSPRTIPIQRVESPLSPQPASPLGGAAPSTLVTVSRFPQHTEVTKPYELSDFYRYSEKLRRQRIIDQYQRQLIGSMTGVTSPDRVSRSSSPQSVDSSDAHSSHSGSTQAPTAFHLHQHHHQHYQQNRPNSAPLNNVNSSRAVSAPSPFYQQPLTPDTPSPFPHSPSLASTHFPEGHISSSSSSSYTVKSTGPNMQYAVQQSSSYHIQQVHSTAKHAIYTPPQPMACQPVRKPPSGQAGTPDFQPR